ncbi:hypothetical protein D1006_20810 [Burkholderia stabilis]|uniref:Uncharacterized protein n=1 Tax=Burkholderia stabilis TaxID=95485 RepID=A0A4Q2AE04_9BURK|nr:hypothetical protein [Burkholderia stabilis]RXV67693.1 hypothetical protein D1006_20810 [Burkholderia stabilis]
MNPATNTASLPFHRILPTGAGGNLGRRIRAQLHRRVRIGRVTDIVDPGEPAAGKEVVHASSNRVTGFYPVTQVVETEMPARPADSSIPFERDVPAGAHGVEPADPAQVRQGGPFVPSGPMEDPR